MRLLFFIFIFINIIFNEDAFSTEITTPMSVKFNDEATRILQDSKIAAITPFDMGKGSIGALAMFSATAALYRFDSNIRDEMWRISSKDLNNAASIGNFIGSPYLHLGAAVTLYGGAIMADSEKWEKRGGSIISSLVIADGATLFIKESTGRERPFVSGRNDRFSPFNFTSGNDSFPSMHTASSFAVSAVVASWYEDLTTKMIIHLPATFTSFSRVYSGKHWSSDVLFGALLGEYAGVIASNSTNFLNYKNVAFYPSVTGKTLIYNVGIGW